MNEKLKEMKILAVDDEETILNLIKLLLLPTFPNITLATNGKEALATFKKEKFDIILSDLNMPEMNGIEFLKEVRALKSDIPCIFFTGYGTHVHMLDALKYGAYDFIDKPNFETLLETIERCLLEEMGEHPLNDSNLLLTEYKKMLRDQKK